MPGGRPRTRPRPDAVKSVAKVLDILEHLGVARSPVSVSDLARATGFNVSTAFRLVQTLVARGYAEQQPGHRSYVLGPRVYQLAAGSPKGIETEKGITPIQPFETPYSWVVNVDVDDETIERVRELYAAEITFVDEWIGRLMNRLADQNLLDETVVYYMSDHGLTLGEEGVLGKHGARAQWHIYHVPCMIRHPEGKLAGETSDFFASTHDVSRTALSFMGIRAPGIMNGEDLSVIFEGGQPSPRPRFTSCYDNYLLCGDRDWFFISDSEGRRKRLYDKHADPLEQTDVADRHPEIVDRMWRVLEDEAGGTLPQFAPSGPKGVIGG